MFLATGQQFVSAPRQLSGNFVPRGNGLQLHQNVRVKLICKEDVKSSDACKRLLSSLKPKSLVGEEIIGISDQIFHLALSHSSIPNSRASAFHFPSTSARVLASITISSGHGRPNPSVDHLRVASRSEEHTSELQ